MVDISYDTMKSDSDRCLHLNAFFYFIMSFASASSCKQIETPTTLIFTLQTKYCEPSWGDAPEQPRRALSHLCVAVGYFPPPASVVNVSFLVFGSILLFPCMTASVVAKFCLLVCLFWFSILSSSHINIIFQSFLPDLQSVIDLCISNLFGRMVQM